MTTLYNGARIQVITASGVEVGAQVFTYAAGTLTPLATYTNQGGGSANANPVICDANGQAPVWFTPGLGYRVIVKRSVANGGATLTDDDNIIAPQASGSSSSFSSLTVTGNTVLGSATTATLNVGAGGIIKDASGNVGIGMTPVNIVDVTKTQNTVSLVKILNASTGTSAGAGFGSQNSIGVQSQWFMTSSTYNVTPIAGANAGYFYADGTGGIAINASQALGTIRMAAGGVITQFTLETSGDVTCKGIAFARQKTASQAVTSSTTLTDDTHLQAQIGTGTFAIDLFVPVWATTGGAGGFKFAFAFTGTLTSSSIGVAGVINGAAIPAALTVAYNTPVAYAAITAGTGVTASDWVHITGTITVSASGNLKFQWAQNSASANSANVGLGGYMNVTKTA